MNRKGLCLCTALFEEMMKKREIRASRVADREVYPALLITVAALGAAAVIWIAAGKPTISNCWFFSEYHIYCPGCGCTRALIALLHGNLLQSVYYNPAVAYTVGLLGLYLTTQTVQRLRRGRGWALRYADWWFPGLVSILAVNCLLRNILWWGAGIPL